MLNQWRRTCGTCDEAFGSRNELFAHLHRCGHVRHGEAPRARVQQHAKCTGCSALQPKESAVCGICEEFRVLIAMTEIEEGSEKYCVESIMRRGGWTPAGGGGWRKDFIREVKMPTIEGVRLKSRTTRDLNTGALVESLVMSPATKPKQLKRMLKHPRDVSVIVEVDELESVEMPWEEEPLEGEDASLFRAVAARLNYLAVDRPDILLSAKGNLEQYEHPEAW